MINFISSKDVNEECVMHSDNTEFMTHGNSNDIADEVFESLILRY